MGRFLPRLTLGGWISALLFAASSTSGVAFAQAPPPGPMPAPVAVAEEAVPEQVVVSGSLITASGFNAPTPTTVLSTVDLQNSAQPNIFDTITQLPSLQGSTGATVANGGTSSGNNGLSTFNLRGLGTLRTLTLFDGQRVVPAYVTGVTDVSLFPQLLIQRVDVVTGGASASWGSDAVGGVVNFVTDKKFTGFTGNFQGGITTYGDDRYGLLQLAAGTGLLGGRAHIEGSIEYYHSDGIPTANQPGGALPDGRCCQPFVATNGNLSPTPLTYTPTTTPAGSPELIEVFGPLHGAQPINYSTYGLILAGPLKGTQFNANGTTSAFQYGSPCVGAICSGGDLSGVYSGTTIDAPLTRGVVYTRVSYDVLPDIEVYATFTGAEANAFNQPNPGRAPPAALTIQCGNAPGGPNAFLPASINAACIADKITNFSYGVSDLVLPHYIGIHSDREQRRYVVGADGGFSMFGTDWTFDSYFEHGENDTRIHINDISLTPRFNDAVDAVAGPNGTVVCRAGAAAPGCVPINLFGDNPIDPTAYAYIDPVNGPRSFTAQRQDAVSIVVNGSPFQDWAGEVVIAYGAAYREEAYHTVGDPYGNGVTATDPYTAQYPADPVLSAGGNNWYAGNFHNGSGVYHVGEAFLEAGIPLIDTPEWGEADFNMAGRATYYNTSGYVETWKLGVTWNTPLDGVRLRALQSRDVRAPNLNELFAAPLAQSQPVINDLTGAQPRVLVTTTGNPNLKPETAQTTNLGTVFQPDYIPGLRASVDYYRVSVKKEIGTLTSQQEIDLCQISGNQSYCPLFNLNGPNPFVNIQPLNLASVVTDGFDFELDYQFDLQQFAIPGDFTFRGLTTHVSKYILNTGVPGQAVIEYAGNITNPGGSAFVGGVPTWKSYFVQTWNSGPVELDVFERFYGSGAINPYAIQCVAPSCPAPTIQNPTININHTPGPFYLDLGGSYQFENGVQAYFKIDNVTDFIVQPFTPPYETTMIGRMYRIGLRFAY